MSTTTATKPFLSASQPTKETSQTLKISAEPSINSPSLSSSSHSDPRYPLFLGNWERSIPYIDDSFATDNFDEPHIKRKITILEKHPEIETLYGYEPRTRLITYIAVAIQISMAFLWGRVWTSGSALNWFAFVATAWAVGGSLTQILGIVLHEASHCLVAESPMANKMLALFANTAIPFPIAMSFRRYHLEHHAFQGVLGRDPDLPLDIEYRLVRGNAFLKFLWLFIYPAMYVIRGAAFGKDISFWEGVNIFTAIIGDVAIVWLCGWRGLFYLFLSLWLGYGIHPAAAHFIQEHYTFVSGQETYSYYGSFNKFFLNIGYHNEHHDFQKVAWSNLPAVRAMAPEFYEKMASHQSWWAVLWNFVMFKDVGPQSRVARPVESHKAGRRMIRFK